MLNDKEFRNQYLNQASFNDLREDLAFEIEQAQKLRRENEHLKERLKNAFEPPCKIGEVVYWAVETDPGEFAILEGAVASFSIDEGGFWVFCLYKNGITYWYTIDNFKKDVDKTKEAAEERIKKFNKGQNK